MKSWVGIIIFAVIVLLACVLFALKLSEGPKAVPEPEPTTAAITDIHIADKVSKGVHTISGGATVPTACTVLTASSTVLAGADASSTPTIRIDLSAPLDTGVCLELPTQVPFSLSVRTDPNASITVYANGVEASTTGL